MMMMEIYKKKEIGKKLLRVIWDNNTEFTDENIIVSIIADYETKIKKH